MCTVPLFLMNKISIFNLYPKRSLNSVIFSVLQFQFKVQVLPSEIVVIVVCYFSIFCIFMSSDRRYLKKENNSFIK